MKTIHAKKQSAHDTQKPASNLVVAALPVSADDIPSSPELVARMLELADIKPDSYVLEPSAGEGALVLAMLKMKPAAITAVEIDKDKAAKLGTLVRGEQVTVYPDNFLKLALKQGDFERVVMHPPQTRNQDIDHVARALMFLASGGILVAVMQANDRRTGMRAVLQQGPHEIVELEERDKVLVRIQKP